MCRVFRARYTDDSPWACASLAFQESLQGSRPRCHTSPAPTVPHGPIWHGATVLVIDDEVSMRRILRRTLEAESFQVEEAENGESALRLVQTRPQPFDLVLTDLAMPLIDGRQVSETLTRYRPTVAVLCMSADPDAVPYIESSDTPVRVIRKPFTAEDLYHAVRDAITRAVDLAAVAEKEIVRAHAGLCRLARALEESRTSRVQLIDLVVAARELRRATTR
ncbi:MAG TPA: response regulator [Gemmatimonadales bacterium]|nr:response regulator [Gemmatimonadales bacterium]